MSHYTVLKQANLVDQVFQALRRDILGGRLSADDRFPPQETLARQFGVSRTVIREAQNKLSSLGLIRSEQGRGTFVCLPETARLMDPMLHSLYLDESSIRELMECRYHLELVIVRLAALRCTPGHASPLETIWKRTVSLAEKGDMQGFSREDFAFHHYLAVISQNRVFCRILDTIRDLNVQFLVGFTKTEGAIERAVRFHKRIMTAVTANDPALAEEEMAAHLSDIISAVRRHYRFDLDI